MHNKYRKTENKQWLIRSIRTDGYDLFSIFAFHNIIYTQFCHTTNTLNNLFHAAHAKKKCGVHWIPHTYHESKRLEEA